MVARCRKRAFFKHCETSGGRVLEACGWVVVAEASQLRGVCCESAIFCSVCCEGLSCSKPEGWGCDKEQKKMMVWSQTISS